MLRCVWPILMCCVYPMLRRMWPVTLWGGMLFAIEAVLAGLVRLVVGVAQKVHADLHVAGRVLGIVLAHLVVAEARGVGAAQRVVSLILGGGPNGRAPRPPWCACTWGYPMMAGLADHVFVEVPVPVGSACRCHRTRRRSRRQRGGRQASG